MEMHFQVIDEKIEGEIQKYEKNEESRVISSRQSIQENKSLKQRKNWET